MARTIFTKIWSLDSNHMRGKYHGSVKLLGKCSTPMASKHNHEEILMDHYQLHTDFFLLPKGPFTASRSLNCSGSLRYVPCRLLFKGQLALYYHASACLDNSACSLRPEGLCNWLYSLPQHLKYCKCIILHKISIATPPLPHYFWIKVALAAVFCAEFNLFLLLQTCSRHIYLSRLFEGCSYWLSRILNRLQMQGKAPQDSA